MSCSKRGDAASCNYSNGNQNWRDKRDDGSRTSEAQLRLQKLEQMVANLMQTTKESSGSRCERKPSYNATLDQRLEDLSVNSLRQNFEASSEGYLDINGSETNYHGATHWAAILDNVTLPSVEEALDMQLTCSRFEIFKTSLNRAWITAKKHLHPLSWTFLTFYSTQLNP